MESVEGVKREVQSKEVRPIESCNGLKMNMA
jgi:hypothetical protein